MPVTVTEKLHEALAFREEPERLMLVEPAEAVIVPPPQDPDKPFGVVTTNPAGNESVKPMPVSMLPEFGFARVKLREVLLFNGIVAAPNALEIVGGEGFETPLPPLPPPQPFRSSKVPAAANVTVHNAAMRLIICQYL